MDRLASVLVLRARVAHPPDGELPRERFVRELEAELAALGWLLTEPLRWAIAHMPKDVAVAWADWLLATLQGDVGGDRAWVPLYRRFPASTPIDTDRLYVERMLAHLLQAGAENCVLCGASGTVQPVRPCGHLVCRRCFNPAEYTACPICHRRLDPTDPYLTMPAATPDVPGGRPQRLRWLHLGRGADVEATALRDDLAGRRAPLSADERADLEVLIDATVAPGDLSWIPEIPARETKAVVAAQALRHACAPDGPALDEVVELWDTATDIACTLWTLSGGDPGLQVPRRAPVSNHPSEAWRPADEPAQQVPIPRVGVLPRSLRRAVLAALDALPMPTVIEDVLRHRTVWKRLAERLHPFEYAAHYPRASLAFTVLRDSRHHEDSAAGRAVLSGVPAGWVRLIEEQRPDGRYVGARMQTFAALVETQLNNGDADAALRTLSTRPGELVRRLDHLARRWSGPPESLIAAARQAAIRAAPRVVLAARASLANRDREILEQRGLSLARSAGVVAADSAAAASAQAVGATRTPGDPTGPTRPEPHPEVPGRRPASSTEAAPDRPHRDGSEPGMGRPHRVFFPQGGAAFVWSAPDRRELIAAGLPGLLRSALADALTDRARLLPSFDLAIVDSRLADIPVPSGTQTVAGTSQPLPRGSLLSLPEHDTLRLFLHWVEPDGTRVDLDLSVALLDAQWRRLDHCDYTRLRSPLGAVHSGDLTSAPGPLGASEFLDLDLAALRAAGVVWAVPVVFSYSDMPFANLDAAIAGVMVPHEQAHFDPAGVLVRYDLVGDSKRSVPCVVNLADSTVRWLDQHLRGSGYGHSVTRAGDALGGLVADLESLYTGTSRPMMDDLALIHARARAAAVLIWDGERYADEAGNTVPAPSAVDRRVFVVCLDAPPALPGLDGEASVTVSVLRGGEPGMRPISDLLDELGEPG